MIAAYPTRSARTSLGGYVVLGGMQGGAWRALGAITPQQAADQVSPSSSSLLQRIKGGTVADAAAGQLLNASGVPSYQPGTADCAATGMSSNVKLAQISGQMALTGLNVAAMTSATVMSAVGGAVVLGAATLGIGAVIGLFPLLFGHHAAAVKKEQTVLCTAVPAANNYLKIIDQAVQSGQATPQQGIAALQSLQADFDSAVSSIRQDCNAACVMSTQLKAIVLYKSSVYQDLAAAAAKAAPPATSSSGPVTAPVVASGSTLQIPQAQPAAPSSSGPNWLGIAALVAAGFLVARFV